MIASSSPPGLWLSWHLLRKETNFLRFFALLLSRGAQEEFIFKLARPSAGRGTLPKVGPRMAEWGERVRGGEGFRLAGDGRCSGRWEKGWLGPPLSSSSSRTKTIFFHSSFLRTLKLLQPVCGRLPTFHLLPSAADRKPTYSLKIDKISNSNSRTWHDESCFYSSKGG